jgi:hypothetical protein
MEGEFGTLARAEQLTWQRWIEAEGLDELTFGDEDQLPAEAQTKESFASSLPCEVGGATFSLDG